MPPPIMFMLLNRARRRHYFIDTVFIDIFRRHALAALLICLLIRLDIDAAALTPMFTTLYAGFRHI